MTDAAPQENLLDDRDEQFLRLLFENIQRYRHERPDSSEVMLPIVAGWAMAAARDSVQEAYDAIETAQQVPEEDGPSEVLARLSSILRSALDEARQYDTSENEDARQGEDAQSHSHDTTHQDGVATPDTPSNPQADGEVSSAQADPR